VVAAIAIALQRESATAKIASFLLQHRRFCHLDSCIGAAAFLFLLRRRNSRLMLLFSCPSIVASVKIQKNEVLCVIPSFPPPTLLLFYFLIPNSVSSYI